MGNMETIAMLLSEPSSSPMLSSSIKRKNLMTKTIGHSFALLLCGASLLIFASTSSAVVVDGVLTASDGYTHVQQINFQLQNGTMVQDPGTLAWSTDAQGNVYVAFVQPLSINDNTYGTNAIGWGSKGHKFGDLTGSDKAQFNFTNGAGQTFIYTLDYLTATSSSPSGYNSLGVTGGDGSVGKDNFSSVASGTTIHGQASDVLSFGSSLAHNFNQLGFNQFTTNSPATAPNHLNPDGTIDYSQGYADPASAPGWVYSIQYEIEISASAFGPSGFGGVSVPAAHDSPSKFGQNTIVVVPEAANYLVGIVAVAIAALFQIRQRRVCSPVRV
jgi:hypothetical protein